MSVLVRHRRLLIGVILVALIVLIAIGGRGMVRLGYRLLGPPPPPRQTDVSQIADWMSVPYVSRAYRVPPTELFTALGVEPERRRTYRLSDIANETGRSSDEVVSIVRETVTAWQTSHPTPPGPGTPKPVVPPENIPPEGKPSGGPASSDPPPNTLAGRPGAAP